MTFLFLKETAPKPTPVLELLGLKRPKAVRTDSDATIAVSPLTKTSQAAGDDGPDKPLPLRALLTRNVIIAAGNYASLALVDIAFCAIQPLFLATPIEFGGLGLPPPTIGNLLSVYGILNGASQGFFFAHANDRFGSKTVFLVGIGSALLVFSLFPFINFLARTQGYSSLVWGVVLFQLGVSATINFSYG